MQKKIIAVNGCSSTEEWHLETEQRWSNIIGCDVNLAHGGASNDRIFTTTIEYLNQYTPDVLIVGWSSLTRGMSSTSRGTRVIINTPKAFDEENGKELPDFHKFFYSNICNQFYNFTNTLNQMIHLQEYCKAKNIKLLYWNTLLPGIGKTSLEEIAGEAFMSRENKDIVRMGIKHNRTILENLISKLDQSIWIKKFWYGMRDHCQGYDRIDDGHFGHEASAHWANLVKEHL